MHRFYLPSLEPEAATATLQGGEALHAAQVLRVRQGESVCVLNGRGLVVTGTVEAVSRSAVRVRVRETERVPAPTVELVLFQALIKPKSMDWVVQKATELGLHSLQPVVTARTVPIPQHEETPRKREKWNRIAVEALKQCGQPWLPRVETPRPLDSLLTDPPCSFIASLHPDAKPLRDWLSSPCAKTARRGTVRVGLWIGPEGDFTPEETARLRAAGAHPISLGTSVLRSETAAVCALALLHYEAHRLPAWLAR